MASVLCSQSGKQRSRGLAGIREDLFFVRNLAVAHDHTAIADDAVDDVATRAVDEVAGQRMRRRELRSLAVDQYEVGGPANLDLAPGQSEGRRWVGGPHRERLGG